jgi:selenide,water dikinase
MNAPEKIRLTEFSHGGGCGCKIAPAILTEILASTPIRGLPPELLVGTETADDAAVYRLNDSQALVATTDFFTPIVDDPYDFGRIAATNAISDIYAMGARPIMALAIVGMPLEKLPVSVIQRSSRAASRCARRRTSRSPAGTPSIRWSRSTGWWRSASCTRTR